MEINDANAKQIAEALLSAKTKMFNKSDEELLKLIVDDEGNVVENATEQLLTLDTSRVSRFKEDGKEKFKNGYAKAKEEERRAAAKLLKEQLGIEHDSDDLEEILTVGKEQIEAKTKKTKTELTPEMVKQHPEYLKLEKERVPKTEYDKLVEEFTGFKSTVERKEKFSVIKSYARKKLEELNPNFPEVPTVRDNLVNVYLATLERYDYSDDGSGGYIVIENGERKNDAHGNPITLEQIAKETAGDFFTFKKQDPKGGTGNKGAEPGNPNANNLVFNSEMDYVKYMQQFKGDTKEEMLARKAGMEAHKAAKAAGKY